MIVDGGVRDKTGFGSVRDFSRLVRRHKLLVLLPMLAGAMVGYLIFVNTPSRYVATAVVALDVRKITVVPIEMVISGLPQESPALRTEIDVLGSRSMAERVIERLGTDALAPLLEEKPSSGLAAALTTVTGTLAGELRDLARAALGRTPPAALAAAPAAAPPPTEEEKHQALVSSLIGGLLISNDGRSYTIHISFTANDPAFAARIANSYAEAYFAHQTTLELNAVRMASEWLGNKVDEMRNTLEAAEQAVELFKQKAGLLEVDGTSIDDRRLDALSVELVRARGQVAEARARLETAAGLAQEFEGLASFSEVLSSPIILALREQQARLLREQEALQDAGAMKSGRLPAIGSELRALDGQIRLEVDRVIESLRNEVHVAEHRQQQLEAAVRQQIAASGEADHATIHLNQLQREADASGALYESFLNRYKAIIEQEDLAGPEAQLISRAQPPMSKATPTLLPLLAFGIFVGAATGIGAAYLNEHFDDRVWSAASLEERCGVPVLGVLPWRGWLATHRWLAGLRQHWPFERPACGGYDLSLQRLQAVLKMSPISRNPKIITLTSAVRGEGKSFVAVALARAFAATGESVLLLGADLHRPALSERLRVKPGFHWEEVVAGEKSLDDILQHDQESNVDIIAASPSHIGAMALFGSPAFEALITALRGRYDRIIIDTPPVSAFADAAMLGTFADVTLLVVRWRGTTHTAVVEALKQMELYSVPASGIVLNQVDVRSSARYAPRPARSSSTDPAAAAASPHWGRSAPPRLTSVAGGLDRSGPAATEDL